MKTGVINLMEIEIIIISITDWSVMQKVKFIVAVVMGDTSIVLIIMAVSYTHLDVYKRQGPY